MFFKTVLLFFIVYLAFLLENSPVSAQGLYTLDNENFESRVIDKRAQIIKEYLAKYNSPLQYHAQDFVDAADKYNLDWRLVASISGVESTFGKFVPGGTDTTYTSYNAWGWGVYGTQAIYFKSWKDGIYTVSEGLRKNYVNKGLTNPYDINRVYAASPTWGSKVSYFLQDLDKFKTQYLEKENNKKNLALNLKTQVAVSSGVTVKE